MRPLVAAAAAALLLAGCGGGVKTAEDRVRDADAAQQRRQAFIQRADTICIESRRETLALKRPTTLAEFKRYATRGLRIGERLRAELGELKPPQGLRRSFEEYLQQLDASIAAAREIEAAIIARDSTRVQTAQNRAREISVDLSSLAESMGLGGCSYNRLPARPSSP